MNILIGLATYNESQNIGPLLHEIHQQLPEAHILVVDDASPDGTGRILDDLKKDNPHLFVIHRSGKLGLGTAHLTLMNYAIEQHYHALITMDADFSHHPQYLPQMRELLGQADFIIGSRFMKGGACLYGPGRKFISRMANFSAQMMLGIPLSECTTSYRGIQVGLLREMNLKVFKSNGYSFFVEFIFRVLQHTPRVKEFPIIFADRSHGVSKINKKEILKSIIMLFKLRWESLRRPLSDRIGEKKRSLVENLPPQ